MTIMIKIDDEKRREDTWSCNQWKKTNMAGIYTRIDKPGFSA